MKHVLNTISITLIVLVMSMSCQEPDIEKNESLSPDPKVDSTNISIAKGKTNAYQSNLPFEVTYTYKGTSSVGQDLYELKTNYLGSWCLWNNKFLVSWNLYNYDADDWTYQWGHSEGQCLQNADLKKTYAVWQDSWIALSGLVTNKQKNVLGESGTLWVYLTH